MTTKPVYKIPRDFETEWIANKPGQHNTQRFERLLSNNDTRQKSILESMPTPIDIRPTNLATIYAVKNKQWTKVGYKCIDCGKPMNDPEVVKKHTLICTNDKKINKLEEQEILNRVGKPAILTELPDDLLYEE